MAISVFVRDDLVQVGYAEDGEAVIARSFYLVAEDVSGRRLAHDFSVLAFPRDVEAAEGRLKALQGEVQEHIYFGGDLDSDHWVEIDPAYGSGGYQALDAVGYFRAQERHDAHKAGEAGVELGSEIGDLVA